MSSNGFLAVCVTLILAVMWPTPRASDLCGGPPFTLCRLTLKSVHLADRHWHALVADYAVTLDESAFCLQDIPTQMNAQNLYTGLRLYQAHVQRLLSSADSYMLTDDYQTESQVVHVAQTANAFLERAQEVDSYLNVALDQLYFHDAVNASSTIDCPLLEGPPAAPADSLAEIYSEAAFVSGQLEQFVLSYRRECAAHCSMTRRKRRQAPVTPALTHQATSKLDN